MGGQEERRVLREMQYSGRGKKRGWGQERDGVIEIRQRAGET